MFKNCKLAKIEQDIGARGGERLGVAQMTVSYDVNKNCSLAKIVQDLGEQWNEQGVAVGTVNSMFKIAVLQNCTPTSASTGTSRYQMTWQIIAILQKFAKISASTGTSRYLWI